MMTDERAPAGEERLDADMWGDLEAEARAPGPTMTITKAQYAALREAIAAAPSASPAPLREAFDAGRATGTAEGWADWTNHPLIDPIRSRGSVSSADVERDLLRAFDGAEDRPRVRALIREAIAALAESES